MIALIKSIQTTYLWRNNLLLTAVKLQMFSSETRHVWHPIRTCFLSLFHA